MNSYRKQQWLTFRKEVLELDGYACTQCGRTMEQGAILQVHHTEYRKDKAPWDYPLDLCETLCKGCHAAEHGKIPPLTGWTLVGEDDLGGLYGECELCGTAIRYSFLVQHASWEPMDVGTDCCDRLTGTLLATELRKQDERRNRFCKSKRWCHQDRKWSIRQRGIDVLISSSDSGFRIQIDHIKGQYTYSELDEAKKKVFAFIESGDAKKRLDKWKRKRTS